MQSDRATLPSFKLEALRVATQLRVANLPDHASAEVRHVVLRERKGFLATRQRLEELAGEHAAVVAVLLLRGILRSKSGIRIKLACCHARGIRTSNT